MPSDKLIDTLHKLKKHAESAQAIGSEAEAQAFAAMFQRLLTKNKLEMSDIDFQKFEREEPVESKWVNYGDYPDIKIKRRRVEWMEKLASVIAYAHECRILVHTGSNMISFVGRRSDVQVVEYMFITLVRATEKLADDAYAKYSIECVQQCEGCLRQKKDHVKRGDTLYCRDGGMFEPNWAKCRGYRPSFIDGFIRRLFVRYDEEKRRMQQQYGSQALMRIKTPQSAFDEFNEKRKLKTASEIKSKLPTNAAGFRHGKEAADKINLDPNAIEGASSVKQLK